MITITAEAAQRVKKWLAKTGLPETTGLRFSVVGGGCSGLRYGFSVEPPHSPDDIVFEQHGLKLFVDPASIRFLDGSEIYWENNGLLGRFGIRNPNAAGTCGCGQSFDPKK